MFLKLIYFDSRGRNWPGFIMRKEAISPFYLDLHESRVDAHNLRKKPDKDVLTCRIAELTNTEKKYLLQL